MRFDTISGGIKGPHTRARAWVTRLYQRSPHRAGRRPRRGLRLPGASFLRLPRGPRGAGLRA